MKRREFLKWASISGAAATAYQFRPLMAAPRKPIDGDTLRFITFGDWGSGNSLQKGVARAMSEHCRAARSANKRVDFAISTGDNFYNDGVKNPADAQWETKFEAMYPAATMPFPFYAVLGNHDWRLDPKAQLLYGQKPNTRWNMDGFYYARSMGGTKAKPLADFFFFRH
jgi:tartrate-resistant acid phosphatase type 5